MLTDKQNKFVDEYLVDYNATQAAIRTGYSKKTAYSQGQRLLKNVEIAAEINRRQAESSKKLQITREGLLSDLMEIAQDNKKNFPPSALKAIEMIGKWLGYDKPEDGSTVEDDTEIKITIVKKDGNKGNDSI
jgi:phage terminase small subunit